MAATQERAGVAVVKTSDEWHTEILLRSFCEWLENPHPVDAKENRVRYDQKFEERYGIKPVEAIYEIRGYFDYLCCLCWSLKDTPAANWTDQQKYLFLKLRNSIKNQVEHFEQKMKPALKDLAIKKEGRQSDPFVGPPAASARILMAVEERALLTLLSICSSFRKGIGLEQSEW